MASFGKGATKSKAAKKIELAEKVQEIQMRQKNWMQQREKELQNKSKRDSAKGSTLSQNSPSKPVKSEAKQMPKKPSEQPVQSSTSQLHKERFKSWMAAQEKHKQSKHAAENDPDSDHEVNVLQVDSSRSPGFATPEPDFYRGHTASKDEYSNIHSKYRQENAVVSSLMSHQDFDALADSIVSRVKSDLNMKDMGYRGSEHVNSRGDMNRLAYTQSHAAKGENSDLSSHYCPLCQNLMLSPVHSPTIFVPCGHSVCQSCADYRTSCPSCRSQISSKTCNIMLQQIIQDYHSKREMEIQRETNHRHPTYSAENYKERHGRSKDSRSKVKYREEYENLRTRQDVLKAEVKSLQGHMKSLSTQIEQEERQINNVTREEDKVKGQIRSLEEKLKMLESHREQYERGKENLKRQKEEERNKLNMVQDTLLSVEIEMEKVKLLAEQ